VQPKSLGAFETSGRPSSSAASPPFCPSRHRWLKSQWLGLQMESASIVVWRNTPRLRSWWRALIIYKMAQAAHRREKQNMTNAKSFTACLCHRQWTGLMCRAMKPQAYVFSRILCEELFSEETTGNHGVLRLMYTLVAQWLCSCWEGWIRD